MDKEYVPADSEPNVTYLSREAMDEMDEAIQAVPKSHGISAAELRKRFLVEHSAFRESEAEQAADIYKKAVQRGIAPVQEVMRQLGVSRTTATRRVREARERGLLHEDSKPTYSSKLVAVAQALGVGPDALRDAVLEHADGDLRVQRRG